MWLKSLCLVLITVDVLLADDFLSDLYGLEQRNKVLICLKRTETRRERECTGAVLHDQWVGIRAGCLRQHPLDHVFLLRPIIPGESCKDITSIHSSRYSRSARAVYYHPWADLAMINVDMPYFHLDRHPNSTKWTVPRAFKQHGTWKWMKQYIDVFALERDSHHYYQRLERSMISHRRPFFVLFVTIILPILVLILVYYCTIIYTSSSSDISYKNFQYTKKATQV